MGGKMPEDAWSDGVADIIGIGKYHMMPDGDEWGGDVQEAVAFEVKSKSGQQRPSQVEFQRRWERAGGRYYIVRSIDDVMEAMR